MLGGVDDIRDNWGRICWGNKRDGRKGVIDGRLDGEEEESEAPIAQVGDDGCGIGVEAQMHLFYVFVPRLPNDGIDGGVRKSILNLVDCSHCRHFRRVDS